MERNTKTTFGELKEGDRFHLLSDKSKEVWQKVHEKKPGYEFTIELAKRDYDRWPIKIKQLTAVIFLRHTK